MKFFTLFEKFRISGYYHNGELDRTKNLQLLNLQTGLVLLRQCGCSPLDGENKNFYKKFLKWLMFWCILITTILVIIGIFVMDRQLTTMVKLFESTTTIVHVSAKFYIILGSRHELKSLILQTSKFWRIEETNEERYNELVKQLRITKKIVLSFICVGVFTIITFDFKAFFGVLPLVCWSPKTFSIGYWLIAFSQWGFFFTVGFLVLGFDALFVAMCYNLNGQFQLLNDRICETNFSIHEHNADENVLHSSIVKFSEYHQFLLDYGNTLQKAFTAIFLPQYSIALLSFCVELFNVLDENTELAGVAQSFMYFASLFIQFALYCFPCADVTMETERISTAIYGCNWYMSTNRIRKELLFMLMRTQRPLTFSAGGLADMNRETFTDVFRMSMSFLTFINTMNNK